ncbi:DUF402 domain-containing protein [Corynebacterium argentoratense]|uniref:DUF402 domain-containing protein n=1 Tax=Corynebacterium argentoratense TaxID=42817 RepID=UPI0040421A4D
MTHIHPVKQETFAVDRDINIDPKGFKRAVDTYRITDFGLYMARGANHPNFGYLESWLLPQLGLRANRFHYRDTAECSREDFYFDVADISRDGNTWTTRDLYVDLISHVGSPIDVDDIDELAAATSEKLITAEEAERAIETTLAAVDGITRHNDDPMAWLRSQGIDLCWAESVELTPVG